MSNTDTDALVPVAWFCPSRAPNWHASLWHSGSEPPPPLTREEAIDLGWKPLYGPVGLCAAIERLTRERDEAVAREREPLNFDQLQSVIASHFGGRELTDDEADSAEAFARAVERAHGIRTTKATT